VSGSDLGIFFPGSSPEPVGLGANLTFTADVLNLGPHDATGVAFADTLPNNVHFVSATATSGSCVKSQGIVSCTVNSLPSAMDSKVSIVVTPGVAGAITNSMSVTANEPDPVSANNTATQTADVVPVFTLTIIRTGNGAGTVTSNEGSHGINCGGVCSATYLRGSPVTLSEIPDTNSVLADWSGGCTGTGPCTVAMNADQNVTANFVLGEKLSIALAGVGSGSVNSSDGAINCPNSGGNCSSLYAPGTSLSLTATTAGTSSFGGWSGACTGTNPSVCTVILNSAESVTATFNPPSDFSIVPATSTFTTQTGIQVTDVLTLTQQGGFSGQVNLNCAVNGPPPLVACSLSPSSVTIGSSPGTSTLTISAPATLSAAALPLNGSSATRASVLSFFVFLLGGLGLFSYSSGRQQRTLSYLAGSLAVLAVLAGCGATTPAPPTQKSYTVTVNAVSGSGSLQHSTTVVLTVQ
jgi:uncharacterized repeat protein (TIGR01451 family)